MMRYAFLSALALLAGCQGGAMVSVDASGSRIPPGMQLVLKQAISIPAGSAHVKLQHGQLVGGVNEYEVNCQFRIHQLGPRVVPPGRFTIRRSGDAREYAIRPWTVRYFKSITLAAEGETEPLYLMCQKWDDVYSGRGVSMAEMQEALGAYFSFEAGQTQP